MPCGVDPCLFLIVAFVAGYCKGLSMSLGGRQPWIEYGGELVENLQKGEMSCKENVAEAPALYCLLDLLFLILQLVELVVDATMCKEFLVCSHLADLTLVHHDNLVGILDRGKSVRNDY